MSDRHDGRVGYRRNAAWARAPLACQWDSGDPQERAYLGAHTDTALCAVDLVVSERARMQGGDEAGERGALREQSGRRCCGTGTRRVAFPRAQAAHQR